MISIDLRTICNTKLFFNLFADDDVFNQCAIQNNYFLQITPQKIDLSSQTDIAIEYICDNWNNDKDSLSCESQSIVLSGDMKFVSIYGFSEIGNIVEDLTFETSDGFINEKMEMRFYGPSGSLILPYGIQWKCKPAIAIKNNNLENSYIQKMDFRIPKGSKKMILPYNPVIFIFAIVFY